MKNAEKISLIIYISLLCLSLNPTKTRAACNPNDQQALLQIKAGFQNTSAFSTWDQNTDCCSGSWRFVRCTSGLPTARVISLSLEGVGDDIAEIIGCIPAAIGDLPFLEVLQFSRLPKLVGPIPASITKLSNLAVLVIKQNNKLGGPIPTMLSKIKSLTQLDLSSNAFAGAIPSSFNKLTGSIPESFASFQPPNGLQLKLMNNQLSGTIPKALARTKLAGLDVTGNRFTGDVSFLFGKNKILGDLSLRQNNFKFDFAKVGLPEVLRTLDISHNSIYGSLPSDQLALFSIDVSYNQLSGPIPSSLSKFNASNFEHNKCLCGAALSPCK
ncbi:Polygalacturonase inhibitor 1 [Bienertia sinuspersici]